MPPKGARRAAIAARTRMQRRKERENVHNLEQLDLSKSCSPERQLDLSGSPRNLSALEKRVVTRNYQPKVNFGEIEVTVSLGYGVSFKPFPDLELGTIKTTMGRANTTDQIQGLIYNNSTTIDTLKTRYDLSVSADIVNVSILFNDGTGQRFRAEFDTRWDTVFAMWAGEVEGGDRPAEEVCRCKDGKCTVEHGPTIEVRFRYAKVADILGLTKEAGGTEDEKIN